MQRTAGAAPERLGDLAVTLYRSLAELRAAVAAAHGARLPACYRLVYQDAAGDWMLLQDAGPWQLFAASAKRLLVMEQPLLGEGAA